MADPFDPKTYLPESIPPEVAAFNAQLEAMLKDLPPNYTRKPQDIRDDRESGKGLFGPVVRAPEARERTIPTPSGDLTLRYFVPEKVDGVYLHIHGGGWVLGRAHHSDIRNVNLMKHCNLAVVSVDYRLAPEHPYPAGPDDCEEAAKWLIAHCQSEFGSDRLAIGGESAGAHLAAVTLLRMRDRHGYTGFRAANVVYGVYDLQLTPSAANWGAKEFILSTPTIQWFVDCYAKPGQVRDPDVSPLFADLRNLPPAIFSVGTLDPLLDDTLYMYPKWIAAGNEAELHVYPGGPHGFNAFPGETATAANRKIDAFLTTRLKG